MKVGDMVKYIGRDLLLVDPPQHTGQMGLVLVHNEWDRAPATAHILWHCHGAVTVTQAQDLEVISESR